VATHHVFLIPGFFGFVNFGRLVYFGHVREYLEDAFARQRMRVEIHGVRLSPTSSLKVRSAELLRFIRETAPDRAPIHLIGHSTGGLDARLLTTPGLELDDAELDPEANARRVRTIVALTTPHRGTPIAQFFSSLMGQQVLRLLSLATITVLRRGRLPIGVLARAGRSLARVVVQRTSPPVEMLRHLERELLGEVDDTAHDLVDGFLTNVQADQTLMPQLTPAAMDLFDAATNDRPGVHYASVIATARPPGRFGRFAVGLDLWAQATFTVYQWLHRQVGAGDGIVPTASQRRGTILHEARGDHLDVLGHYDGTARDPRHTDWLFTGSHFDRPQFDALWSSVTAFVAKHR
jgi:triacylglycerol lipase